LTEFAAVLAFRITVVCSEYSVMVENEITEAKKLALIGMLLTASAVVSTGACKRGADASVRLEQLELAGKGHRGGYCVPPSRRCPERHARSRATSISTIPGRARAVPMERSIPMRVSLT